jgi:serine/threonine protein phosphatase PrpC
MSLSYVFIDCANHSRDQRNQSEDYVLVDAHTGLLGVFDSVGGRDNGLLVSHLAGETIASAWRSLRDKEQKGLPAHLEASLQALIRQADTTIASLVLPSGQKRPAHLHMKRITIFCKHWPGIETHARVPKREQILMPHYGKVSWRYAPFLNHMQMCRT